jgi:hypothetical protein
VAPSLADLPTRIPKMRQAAISIIGLVALVLLCLAVVPQSRAPKVHALKQLMEMRNIAIKLKQYETDHTAAELEVLKTASIDDLVTMQVITASDADYLRSHRVEYHGFDPINSPADAPLFEAVHTHGKTSKRIVCYIDGSARLLPHRVVK